MGIIARGTKSGTGTTAFGGGTVILADEVNSDFNTAYSLVNGHIDNANIASDAAISASKVNLSTIAGNVYFDGNININGSLTCETLQLTTAIIVTGIVDEDDMASNSATALPTQQSVKAYVDASAGDSLPDQTGHAGEYLKSNGSTADWAAIPVGISSVASAGAIVVAKSDASKTSTFANTKIKEIIIPVSGTLRIAFSFTYAGGASTTVQVYRNDSAVGTSWGLNSNDTKTEDISGWSIGDYVQIYTSGSSSSSITNFRISVATPTQYFVTLD